MFRLFNNRFFTYALLSVVKQQKERLFYWLGATGAQLLQRFAGSIFRSSRLSSETLFRGPILLCTLDFDNSNQNLPETKLIRRYMDDKILSIYLSMCLFIHVIIILEIFIY